MGTGFPRDRRKRLREDQAQIKVRQGQMKLHFVTVDVFTGTQFAGNPLGVVLNAEGLSGGQMQAIAAEFNLAETTFVLPPKDPANTAEVRIFTPRYEMPFAGHPNVGTAFALARAGTSYGRAIEGERVIFEEKAGLVPIIDPQGRPDGDRRTSRLTAAADGRARKSRLS